MEQGKNKTRKVYRQVISAQKYPKGSLAYLLEPCTDREQLCLAAYYVLRWTPSRIARQLVRNPNYRRIKWQGVAASPKSAAVRRAIDSGRSKCYHSSVFVRLAELKEER